MRDIGEEDSPDSIMYTDAIYGEIDGRVRNGDSVD